MQAVSYRVCVCARTRLFNHKPSQIQLPPTQCNCVWGGGRLHLLPSDSARSWPGFAQMGRTGGKTQAFPLIIQMFPDIVMFVLRRHLGVCLTRSPLFAQWTCCLSYKTLRGSSLFSPQICHFFLSPDIQKLNPRCDCHFGASVAESPPWSFAQISPGTGCGARRSATQRKRCPLLRAGRAHGSVRPGQVA